jgi:unsaturated rhamnogalacturonyl hydrolase
MTRRTLLLLLPQLARTASAHLDQWRSVAGSLIQTPPESYPFNWGEGVQQIGLMKIYHHTRDARYLDYMERWTDLFLKRDIHDLLDTGPKPRGQRPGYCGYWSPATAIYLLYQAKKRPEYLKLADAVCAFVRDGAERSPERALGHWIGSHQLWVDTLYMACPLLAALGKHHKQPAWIEDAAQQIIVYAKHLQDPATGLFYHMWDWQTGARSPSLWGRGNGWVIMSIADTIEMLPARAPSHARLVAISAAMLKGLAKTQDSSGAWRTILDDPASYPEASATSMMCYGLAKLVRLKALPASDALPLATKGWKVVNEQYVRDGVVTGVSAGTDPGNPDKYKTIRTGSQTWGTGAYLMAGSEMARL